MQTSAAQAVRRIASVFSTDLLVLTFGVANTILATRLLGPTGRGVVVLALNTATLAQSLATLGLPWALGYYAARDRESHEARCHAAWLALRFAPLVMTAWALSYIAIYLARGTSVFQGMTPTVVALSAAFSLLLLFKQNLTSYLSGLHDFLSRNIIWAATPGIVVMLLIANLALQMRLTPVVVLWMNVIAAVAATLFGFGVIAVRHRVRPGAWADGASPREFLSYGSKFYIGLLAQALNYRLDSFLVNAMRGVRDVGLYSTAVSATELLLLVPTAVNTVMYPTLASLQGRERDRVALFSTGVTLMVVMLLGAVWLVAAGWLIPLVFGAKFAESVAPARWLVPGMAAIAVVRVLCHAAAAAGKPEVLTYATVGGLAFTVPLDLLLIPRWGIVGASLASSIAYTASAALAVALYGTVSGEHGLVIVRRLASEPARGLLHRVRQKEAAPVEGDPAAREHVS